MGRELARTSFLGVFLQVSVFAEDEPKVAEKFFSGNTSSDKTMNHTLQQELDNTRVCSLCSGWKKLISHIYLIFPSFHLFCFLNESKYCITANIHKPFLHISESPCENISHSSLEF